MPKKKPLPDVALRRLKASGLGPRQVSTLKIRHLAGNETKRLEPHFRALSALHLPYFDLRGKVTDFYRVRYLERPRLFGQEAKEHRKYDQPADALPCFYLPPLVDWAEVAADASVDVIVTEGELKAACATLLAMPTIGLGGVYAWKSKKQQLPSISDFELFEWAERKVYVIFDSDLTTNVMVQTALYDLCALLARRGAHPYVARLPGELDGTKVGLDDFLVKHGAEKLTTLLEGAEPFTLAEELWKLNHEVVLVENISMVLQRRNNLLLRPSTFTEVNYADRVHVDYRGEKEQKLQAAREWLKWPYRALVRDVVYEPGITGPTDDGNFSIWPGWGCPPVKGDVKPWHEMMAFVFGKDEGARRWFERWCAIQVQRPGVKLHTAVVFWSPEQGSGKSLVGEALLRLFGKNGIEIKYQQLMNPRNAWAQRRQFVMGSEITGSDHRAVADLIKNLITQATVTIDEKYVPEYTVRDTINYYFTSNHPNAFYLDDLDRRFFVWRVPAPREYEFYVRFRDWKNGDGPAALHRYLLDVDLGGFDDKERAMQTEARAAMVDAGRSDLDAWIRDLMTDPDAALALLPDASIRCALFSASQLRHLYAQTRGGSTPVTAQGVALALARNLVPRVNGGKPVRVRAGLVRLFAVRDGKRWEAATPRQVAEHYDSFFGVGLRELDERR